MYATKDIQIRTPYSKPQGTTEGFLVVPLKFRSALGWSLSSHRQSRRRIRVDEFQPDGKLPLSSYMLDSPYAKKLQPSPQLQKTTETAAISVTAPKVPVYQYSQITRNIEEGWGYKLKLALSTAAAFMARPFVLAGHGTSSAWHGLTSRLPRFQKTYVLYPARQRKSSASRAAIFSGTAIVIIAGVMLIGALTNNPSSINTPPHRAPQTPAISSQNRAKITTASAPSIANNPANSAATPGQPSPRRATGQSSSTSTATPQPAADPPSADPAVADPPVATSTPAPTSDVDSTLNELTAPLDDATPAVMDILDTATSPLSDLTDTLTSTP